MRKIGGTDRIGLRRDQVTAGFEPGRGAGEGEGQQKPQQGEHCSFRRARSLRQAFLMMRESRNADAPPDFGDDQHARAEGLRTSSNAINEKFTLGLP